MFGDNRTLWSQSVTSAWKDWTGQKVHLLPFLWFIQLLLPCWQDHHFKAQQTVTFGCLRFFQSCKYDRIRNKLAFVTLLHGLGVFSANSLVNWHISKNKYSLKIIYKLFMAWPSSSLDRDPQLEHNPLYFYISVEH